MYITWLLLFQFIRNTIYLLISKHSTHLLLQLQSRNLLSSVTCRKFLYARTYLAITSSYFAYDQQYWYLFDTARVILAQNRINWSFQVSANVNLVSGRWFSALGDELTRGTIIARKTDGGALLGWKATNSWVNYNRGWRSPPLDCSLKLLIDRLNPRFASTGSFKDFSIGK